MTLPTLKIERQAGAALPCLYLTEDELNIIIGALTYLIENENESGYPIDGEKELLDNLLTACDLAGIPT